MPKRDCKSIPLHPFSFLIISPESRRSGLKLNSVGWLGILRIMMRLWPGLYIYTPYIYTSGLYRYIFRTLGIYVCILYTFLNSFLNTFLSTYKPIHSLAHLCTYIIYTYTLIFDLDKCIHFKILSKFKNGRNQEGLFFFSFFGSLKIDVVFFLFVLLIFTF